MSRLSTSLRTILLENPTHLESLPRNEAIRFDELFERASAMRSVPRHFKFRYKSPEHFIEVFKTYYGPMLKAFATLDDAKQKGLKDDLSALIASLNQAADGTMVLPGEYLEIVITK